MDEAGPRMKQDKFLSMKGIARASEEMGILMTLEREDGEIFEARFKAGDQGKTAELDVKPYLKGWKEKDPPGFEYSIQEYFRIGKTDYTGPKSEAADRPAADVFGEYRTVSTVLEYGSKMFDDLVGSMGLGLGSGITGEDISESAEGSLVVTAAKDAKAIVDGATMSSSTNTLTVNGLTLNLLNTTKNEATGQYDEMTVTVSKDTASTYDLIKNAVNEYNNLLEEMSKLYYADSARG